MANEQRLIDANALLEKFQFRLPTESLGSHSEYLRTISHCVQIARKLISEASTVDALEVVRCRDCVHMKNQFNARFCEVWCMYNGMGDDGFCNYGERKKDEVL